jgi:4-amino-4-deoxy-L-arabinose transferase-like glycosyltransferase
MSQTTGEPGRVAAVIRKRPLILLFLVCFAAWLPGLFTLPPLDRDESRYAQASKQMLETRNFVDIRFGVEPRYKKPVGIYWLQSASTEMAGLVTGDPSRSRIWTYRIPSLVGAFAAVALTFWCAEAFLSIEASFVAALLLGLTFLLAAEAKIAKTDAVLLATIAGAQAVLMRAWLARDPDAPQLSFRTAMLGWFAFAIGILIKGPVIAGVCGMTIIAILAWDREWRWLGRLRPAWGLALTLVVVLPWLIAIALASHGAFYAQALGHDFAGKLVTGQESHGMPPGYYLLVTTATLWPATLFLIPALVAAVKHRGEPAIRFLLCWAAGPWLMFELVPTKLPNYILPCYPALAILMAAWLVSPREAGGRRVLSYASAAYFLVGVAGAAFLLVWAPGQFGGGTSPDLWIAAGAVALLGIGAALSMALGARGPAVSFATATALVAYGFITLDAAPRLDRIRVSEREAAMIARHRRPDDPPPALAGYTEPSAMFLIGTDTRLTNGYGAAEVGAEHGGLAAVEDGQRPQFLAHLAELEADAKPIDAIEGYNYSRGRPVHITLYRVTEAKDITTPPQE